MVLRSMQYQYDLFLGIFSISWIIKAQIIRHDSFLKKDGFDNVLCSEGLLHSMTNIKSAFGCAKVCVENANCLSFFYNPNDTCQLHSTNIHDTSPCAGISETLYYIQKGISPAYQETSEEITTTALETTTSVITTTESCDTQWLSIGTGCYQITSGGTKKVWADAKTVCNSVSGYLASIETLEENTALKVYMSALGTKDYFIGGTDLETEGIFKWDNSGALVNLPGSGQFHDWLPPNQPDNGNNNQHCMVLYGQGSHVWNDVSCTFARDFICEK